MLCLIFCVQCAVLCGNGCHVSRFMQGENTLFGEGDTQGKKAKDPTKSKSKNNIMGKNPAYRRQSISRPMRIVIPKNPANNHLILVVQPHDPKNAKQIKKKNIKNEKIP